MGGQLGLGEGEEVRFSVSRKNRFFLGAARPRWGLGVSEKTKEDCSSTTFKSFQVRVCLMMLNHQGGGRSNTPARRMQVAFLSGQLSVEKSAVERFFWNT
jgi:hypothetical protein